MPPFFLVVFFAAPFFTAFFFAMCSLLERSDGWTIDETHGRLARAERKRKEGERFSCVHSEAIPLARLLAP